MVSLDDRRAYLAGVIERLYAEALAPESFPCGENVISQPEDAAFVLSRPDLFEKDYGLIDLLGRSRFNENGASWRMRRALTQPSYVAAAREPLAAFVATAFDEALDAVARPEASQVNSACLRASVAVFLRALGCDSDPSRFVAHLSGLRDLVVDLQYFTFVRPGEAEMASLRLRSREAIDAFVELMREDESSDALLAHISRGLGDPSLRAGAQELVMAMFAAVEEVSAAMAWLVDRLGVNDMAQARLHAEAMQAAPEKPFIDCFINETLRYFPTIPLVARRVAKAAEINGRPIAEGQQILISIVALHQNRRTWREPHIFDSVRSEFIDDKYDRNSFLPFLQGPRACGGMRLAQLQLQAAAVAMLKRFHFTNPAAAIAVQYILAVRPASDAGVIVQRRV